MSIFVSNWQSNYAHTKKPTSKTTVTKQTIGIVFLKYSTIRLYTAKT